MKANFKTVEEYSSSKTHAYLTKYESILHELSKDDELFTSLVFKKIFDKIESQNSYIKHNEIFKGRLASDVKILLEMSRDTSTKKSLIVKVLETFQSKLMSK